MAKAWLTDARVHTVTDASMPRRVPMRSRITPHTGLPSMYAIENAETMKPYCSALRWVSRRIVGASSASVLRSM